MIVEYECFECGYKGDVVENNNQVICPNCKTINDIWLTSEDPPERHTIMYNKAKG